MNKEETTNQTLNRECMNTTSYIGVTVAITLEHPNEAALTPAGREFAHRWLRHRIGAQLCLALPGARVSVDYAEQEDCVTVEGLGKPSARQAISYANSVLLDSFVDWFAYVTETSGIVDGDSIFMEGLL